MRRCFKWGRGDGVTSGGLARLLLEIDAALVVEQPEVTWIGKGRVGLAFRRLSKIALRGCLAEECLPSERSCQLIGRLEFWGNGSER